MKNIGYLVMYVETSCLMKVNFFSILFSSDTERVHASVYYDEIQFHDLGCYYVKMSYTVFISSPGDDIIVRP
jgi:hypothetical protein